MEESPSSPQKEGKSATGKQEPKFVQLDPKCLHSALKEFFEPLRTNDPRTDFFAVYRKESAEFDQDYGNKYDEDLNTSLIFAGLFSAVSSAFIIDVQSNLQPNLNEMSAAYLRILIHNMNNSLFPDADPSLVTWTGPPPRIVNVQSLLYASLATSLFAAFLAMLGKQWVNRYIRNRGGSAADKSRDRQRKLDGFEKWHFHLAIESLPVMLQVSLLLLGCALSQYLWAISRTVAGVVAAVTLFGVTSYLFLSLVATLYYDCPYQTPPSIIIRTVIKYLTRGEDKLARSLRSLAGSLPSLKNLRSVLQRLRFGISTVLKSLNHVLSGTTEAEYIPLAVALAPPTEILWDISIDLVDFKADARCISWVLESTTDTDVIFSTVRFAADTIWYPEIAGAVSPHVLADLFFDCFLDGQVIPGKLEYASSVGMALASIFSVQLGMEPEAGGLKELCRHINSKLQKESTTWPRSTFSLVVAVLQFIAGDSTNRVATLLQICSSTPDHLSTANMLWFSRIMLQMIWRRTRVAGPAEVIPCWMELIYQAFTAGDNHIPVIPRINCFLTVAISIGLQLDIHDLYLPGTNDALRTVIRLLHRQLQAVIVQGAVDDHYLTSVLRTLVDLNPFQVTENGELGFLWIAQILNSGYQEDARYRMARVVIGGLGKHLFLNFSAPTVVVQPTWIPPVLGFLSLCEKLDNTLDPAFTALRILSISPGYADLATEIIPILTSTLLPIHPLRSRILALEVFTKFTSGWLSPQMEGVPGNALDKLLQAVGDPFKFPNLPLQDGKPVAPSGYQPMMATVVLIGLASSSLWRNRLRHSNFASCEEVLSNREGQRSAIRCMLEVEDNSWSEVLRTATKIEMVIRCLEELRCFNTAQVVIMWAWTVGAVNPMNRDDERLIGRETLRFYQAHGTKRLTALRQHIVEAVEERRLLIWFYGRQIWGPSEPRTGNNQRLVPTPHPRCRSWDWCKTYICLALACQVRRLYHLFGYDHAMWKEAVEVGVDEEAELLPVCSVAPAPFADWACDYP